MSLSLKTGVGMMLLLYLLAFLIPRGSVPHSHDEDDTHIGDSCEKDACHIAIFHPGAEGACNHKYHLTSAPEECLQCHIVVTRQISPTQYSFVINETSFKVSFPEQEINVVAQSAILHNDRGPPVFYLI